jgi:ribonuclease HI
MSKTAVMYFDGGVRDDKIAMGFVVYHVDDRSMVWFEDYGKCGTGTSNVAEYRGLLSGLAACIKNRIDVVYIFSDSQLVTNQVNQVWKVRNDTLRKHRNKALELLSHFKEWNISWVPREKNVYADRLVKLAFGG